MLDHARRLDTADRYLNTKCTRYALRANAVEKAKETVALFLRENDNTEASLAEMQCSWYNVVAGDCFLRQSEVAPDETLLDKALTNYDHVVSYFKDFREDQFDFHT